MISSLLFRIPLDMPRNQFCCEVLCLCCRGLNNQDSQAARDLILKFWRILLCRPITRTKISILGSHTHDRTRSTLMHYALWRPALTILNLLHKLESPKHQYVFSYLS